MLWYTLRAGLKVGVQSVDPSSGRDDSHHGLAEGLKAAANSLPWRVAAARLVVVVADCSPLDRSDKDSLSLKQVRPRAILLLLLLLMSV